MQYGNMVVVTSCKSDAAEIEMVLCEDIFVVSN